jgi:hypothetical protein
MRNPTASGEYRGRHRAPDNGNVRADRNPFYIGRHRADDKS